MKSAEIDSECLSYVLNSRGCNEHVALTIIPEHYFSNISLKVLTESRCTLHSEISSTFDWLARFITMVANCQWDVIVE